MVLLSLINKLAPSDEESKLLPLSLEDSSSVTSIVAVLEWRCGLEIKVWLWFIGILVINSMRYGRQYKICLAGGCRLCVANDLAKEYHG